MSDNKKDTPQRGIRDIVSPEELDALLDDRTMLSDVFDTVSSDAYSSNLEQHLTSDNEKPDDKIYTSTLLATQALNAYKSDPNDRTYQVMSNAFIAHKQLIDLCKELQASQAREKELEHAKELSDKRANTDPLTQISNRNGFNDFYCHSVERVIADKNEHASISIAILDLDTFKQVNDTYGHPNGDLVLQELADFLTEEAEDYMEKHKNVLINISRLGGEEFGITYTNLDTKSDSTHKDPEAAKFFDDIQSKYAATSIILNGDTIRNSTSIGYATDKKVLRITSDDMNEHRSKTLQRADTALYANKSRPDKPTFESRILSTADNAHQLGHEL